MQADRFLIDACNIARDHAALFKELDAAMAGRDRQPDLVGEFSHRDAAVGLKDGEDFAVDGVEVGHWDEVTKNGQDVAKYTNIAENGAKI